VEKSDDEHAQGTQVLKIPRSILHDFGRLPRGDLLSNTVYNKPHRLAVEFFHPATDHGLRQVNILKAIVTPARKVALVHYLYKIFMTENRGEKP